ncbi:hypothetical protein [Lacunimicrobium album]
MTISQRLNSQNQKAGPGMERRSERIAIRITIAKFQTNKQISALIST